MLVDAARVAEYLGVSRAFVYEHADELGVHRLGAGPKARLRFDLAEVDSRLTSCYLGRGSHTVEKAMVEPVQRRRRRPGLGTNLDLLPVKRPRPPALGTNLDLLPVRRTPRA
jgi:hypothetical protein